METKKQEETTNGNGKAQTEWPWMTKSVDKIAAALCKVQGELDVARKDKRNPFYKNSYADLAEIMSVARKPLCKHGIAVTQLCQPCGIDGRTCLGTVLMHTSGQCISSTYPLNPVKVDPQGVGGAVTYARRYALGAILGIVSDGEDDDGETAQGRGSFAKPKFKKENQ